MVTRQRRKNKPRSVGFSPNRTPRLTLLLSILALTTSILIALQISRYHNGKSNIAIDRLLSSIGYNARHGQEGIGDTSTATVEIDAMKQRIAAIGKQFQEELTKVKGTFKGSKQVKGGTYPTGSVAVIPGEEIVDHTAEIPTALRNAPHVADKSEEEAAEDQKIGLEDLDQDTLKAMFDALYSRD